MKTSEEIIEYLNDFSEFDHWWDEIDELDKRIIIKEIQAIIDKEDEADIRAEAINWREAMKEAEEKGYREGYREGQNSYQGEE